MGHPRPLPVAFPVHSGFDMIFAHILEDVMRKVSDRKRIMISADNAFQRTGLTGLRIPGIECAARIGQRQKITLPAFSSFPAAGRRFRERRGNQTERRKTAPLPQLSHSERQTGKSPVPARGIQWNERRRDFHQTTPGRRDRFSAVASVGEFYRSMPTA